MAGNGTVIAVAQLALAVGEVEGNRKLAADAVEVAAARGARLVVLPELCDSGYVFESAAEARELATSAGDSETLRQWRTLASAHDIVIAGGFCELGLDGRLYNSAAIVDGSGTRVLYRKAHLWDAEKKVFTPGDDPPPVVELPFGKIGLMICYDLEFPEWVRLAALAGADLIAAPVNWPAPARPVPPGERPGEVTGAQAAASVNGVFIAVADRCGRERRVDWIGGSVIIGRDSFPLAGPVLGDAPAVLTALCDLSRSRDKRINANNDLFTDRRPELYTPITR
jgi:predicted amidohydrolase